MNLLRFSAVQISVVPAPVLRSVIVATGVVGLLAIGTDGLARTPMRAPRMDISISSDVAEQGGAATRLDIQWRSRRHPGANRDGRTVGGDSRRSASIALRCASRWLKKRRRSIAANAAMQKCAPASQNKRRQASRFPCTVAAVRSVGYRPFRYSPCRCRQGHVKSI